jgi:hypothetical protein
VGGMELMGGGGGGGGAGGGLLGGGRRGGGGGGGGGDAHCRPHRTGVGCLVTFLADCSSRAAPPQPQTVQMILGRPRTCRLLGMEAWERCTACHSTNQAVASLFPSSAHRAAPACPCRWSKDACWAMCRGKPVCLSYVWDAEELQQIWREYTGGCVGGRVRGGGGAERE